MGFLHGCASLIAILLFSLTSNALNYQEKIDVAKERCGKATSMEVPIYGSDYKWWYSLEEMGDRYKEIYNSSKRLKGRAYFDENLDQFILTRLYAGEEQAVKVTNKFLENITRHIEEALSMNYVDYIFFPDMGHSHILVPQDHYDLTMAPINPKNFNMLYELMFDYEKSKIFYHTAEQLKVRNDDGSLIDDRYLQWRFYTRNLAGDNESMSKIQIYKDLLQPANTKNGVDSYKWWGGGFYVNASKDGCFPFNANGETQYFDISLQEFPADPNIPIDDIF